MGDDERYDWEEVEDVEVPESLQKKWDTDAASQDSVKHCHACGKWVPHDAFHCIYCGAVVFHESGVIGRLARFLTSWGGGVVFLIILGIIALYLL